MSTPIYPDFVPREAGHPTFDRFAIRVTGDARGRGVLSLVDFRIGERVARLSGIVVSEASLDTLQMLPGVYFSDPWFCRFLLHDCAPNLIIDVGRMETRAEKDIRSGDWLTIDYTRTEDFLASQFRCECGAGDCKGWIMGAKERANEEGRRFLGNRGEALKGR